MQLPQRPFLIDVECGRSGAEALAFAGLVSGTQQRPERNKIYPDMALYGLLLLSQPPTSLLISSMAFATKP
jgi:hypothetical protein